MSVAPRLGLLSLALYPGAILWGFQLWVSYGLVNVSCGQGFDPMFHLVTLGFALPTAGCVWLSYRLWRQLRGSPGRAEFMAMSGVVANSFFLLLIVVGGVPSFLLSPCTGGGTRSTAGPLRAAPGPVFAPAVAAPALLTPAADIPGDPNRGRTLFVSDGCARCHTLASVPGATGTAGPRLDNIAVRKTIAGETIPLTPDNLSGWIARPASLKPSSTMPATGVSQQDARDLAAFLLSLPANPE